MSYPMRKVAECLLGPRLTVSEPDDEDGSDVLWWRDPENEDATLDECYPEARRVLEAAGFRTVEPFHVTILEQSP